MPGKYTLGLDYGTNSVRAVVVERPSVSAAPSSVRA